MDFDFNKLKVFYQVYLTQSPTLAAKRLYLTQSGVSQHIQSLESYIGQQLFIRDKKKLIPNNLAKELYQKTSNCMFELESFLKAMHDQNYEPEGVVRIGTPTGFCLTKLSTMLCSIKKKYPLINFKIELGEPSDVEPQLLNGSLDFAFTDKYKNDPHIELIPTQTEKIVLAGPRKDINIINRQSDLWNTLLKQEYLAYNEDLSVVKSWFKFHFKKVPKKLHLFAKVFDIPIMLEILRKGRGLAVLPKHIIGEDLNKKILGYIKRPQELENTICIAKRKAIYESRHVVVARQFFIEFLRN